MADAKSWSKGDAEMRKMKQSKNATTTLACLKVSLRRSVFVSFRQFSLSSSLVASTLSVSSTPYPILTLRGRFMVDNPPLGLFKILVKFRLDMSARRRTRSDNTMCRCIAPALAPEAVLTHTSLAYRFRTKSRTLSRSKKGG